MKSEVTCYYLENNNAGIFESQGEGLDALVCSRKFHKESSFSKLFMEIRTFSSHAGAKHSVGQDDMVQKAASVDQVDDNMTSDSELSEDESVNGIQNELDSLDTETDVGKKDSFRTAGPSAMTKAILAVPMSPVSKVLEQWVQEGNEVTVDEVSTTMLYLRQRRMYYKALQVCPLILLLYQIDFLFAGIPKC